jgi:fumarate reductase subunit D
VLYLVSYPFFYHVWHQLREIHRLHRDRADVRLSQLSPMYALARISSLTAIGIVLNNYGWFLAQPGADLNNPVTIGETVFNGLIVVVVFVWPLWGAHRRIAEAKAQAQGDVAARKQSTREQLHQAVDAGRLERVDPLHKVLGALQAENDELAKVPTWPWAPGTLRNLMGAVLLPMALWLIQFGLQRLMG